MATSNQVVEAKKASIANYLADDAVKTNVEKIVGTKEPLKEKKGTIRRMFGGKIPNDVMDASETLEKAERDISIFFKEKVKKYKKED